MPENMGNIYKTKYQRLYHKACAVVRPFRENPFFQELEHQRASGRILPFIRGLRFSAILTYSLREILSGSQLEANWGHLVDDSGNYVSPECDIIIHEKDCPIAERWNGETDSGSIMDFRFIRTNYAKVVISCKSFIKTAKVEEEYCSRLTDYVDRVWLFAECCGPRSFDNIRNRAQEYGYEDFWCLYTQNNAGDLGLLESVWLDFVRKVESLRSDNGA